MKVRSIRRRRFRLKMAKVGRYLAWGAGGVLSLVVLIAALNPDSRMVFVDEISIKIEATPTEIAPEWKAIWRWVTEARNDLSSPGGSPTSPDDIEEIRARVHRLVNEQRRNSVRRDPVLDRRAQEWVERIGHSTVSQVRVLPTQTFHCPHGWYPCPQYWPDWSGENLSWQYGYRDVGKSAVDGWVKSPPHYEFMTHPNHRSMGVGIGPAADGSIIVALAMCS
jgi:hypothetical protein